MAGHTALMAGWRPVASPPPTDPWLKYRTTMYVGTAGQRLALMPGIAGLSNSDTGLINATLPAGWRYGYKGASINYTVALFDTPLVVDGVAMNAADVRQTVAFVGVPNGDLMTPFDGTGIEDHAIFACRHPGTPYYNWKDNRADALLLGKIYGRDKLMTIEGIEGGTLGNNVFPIPTADEYRSLFGGDYWLFVIESLQYGTSPTCRIRLYGRANLVWDSGARGPTGSAFTNANATFACSMINMTDTNSARFNIQAMYSWMHPRDTEIPIASIRDAVGY